MFFFEKKEHGTVGNFRLAGRLARGRRGCEGDAAGFIPFFFSSLSHPIPFLHFVPS
jgi:hypothetical protein